jgi:hypothetical protein
MADNSAIAPDRGKSHIPINHGLRSFYRAVAALCGLYVLIFGIVAVTRTGQLGWFAQSGLPSVLGVRANAAFGIVSIVVGAVIVVGKVVGGNVDRWVNLLGGIVFLVSGFAMLALLQTKLNFLGFSVTTVVLSFLFGMVMFTAGLYGRVGSSEERNLEEGFRHGGPDPHQHAWAFEGGPKPEHQTEDHRFA